jgi:hypothetical protein
MNTLPPHLYKYESLSVQTLKNLKAQILYFGSPRGFNDPYDCALTPNIKTPSQVEVESLRAIYLARTDLSPQQRKEFEDSTPDALAGIFVRSADAAIREATELFLDVRGVTCFSETNDNLLMWSHYGGRSKGICLEFDATKDPFHKAHPVTYAEVLPTLDVYSILTRNDAELVRTLFCTKSKHWAYEREWRSLHGQVGTAYGYTSDALTGVYFGPDIDSETLEIVCLILAGQNETVQLYEGTRSTTEFKAVFQSFTYTNYLKAKELGLKE